MSAMTTDYLPFFKEAVNATSSTKCWRSVSSYGIPSEESYREHHEARCKILSFLWETTKQAVAQVLSQAQKPCFDGSPLPMSPQQRAGLRHWYVGIIAERAVQILKGEQND